MRLEVDVPAKLWGHLVSRAEDQGMTSSALVVAALECLVPAVSGADEVKVLWSRGMSDAEIAAELGWTNQAVARVRRGHGLPANRRVWKGSK